MSETIAFEFLPERYRAEDSEGPLEYTMTGLRTALAGRRMAVARVALRHLRWAFGVTGGIYDPDGTRWVYKTAKQMAQELLNVAQGVLVEGLESTRTIERTMCGLARLGIIVRTWVRIPQGMTAIACYAYRPGPNWDRAFSTIVSDGSSSLPDPVDTAVAHAESTCSDHPHLSEECVIEQPEQPEQPSEPRWVALPFMTADNPVAPEPDPSLSSASSTPEPLDSRPNTLPVQPEIGRVTASTSLGGVLNALNAIRQAGLCWLSGRGFINKRQGGRLLGLREVAEQYRVDPWALLDALEGLGFEGDGPR